jgi:hypothetical protein
MKTFLNRVWSVFRAIGRVIRAVFGPIFRIPFVVSSGSDVLLFRSSKVGNVSLTSPAFHAAAAIFGIGLVLSSRADHLAWPWTVGELAIVAVMLFHWARTGEREARECFCLMAAATFPTFAFIIMPKAEYVLGMWLLAAFMAMLFTSRRS